MSAVQGSSFSTFHHIEIILLDGIIAEAEVQPSQNLRPVLQEVKWQKHYQRNTSLTYRPMYVDIVAIITFV
jgi:hypothetical protein